MNFSRRISNNEVYFYKCQFQVPLVYIIVLGVPYSGGNAPFNLVRPKPGPIFPSTGFKPGFKPFQPAATPSAACGTDADCFPIQYNYIPWSAGNNNLAIMPLCVLNLGKDKIPKGDFTMRISFEDPSAKVVVSNSFYYF